jgi:hypothetical protein
MEDNRTDDDYFEELKYPRQEYIGISGPPSEANYILKKAKKNFEDRITTEILDQLFMSNIDATIVPTLKSVPDSLDFNIPSFYLDIPQSFLQLNEDYIKDIGYKFVKSIKGKKIQLSIIYTHLPTKINISLNWYVES